LEKIRGNVWKWSYNRIKQMEEENVNDFTQSPIPTTGTPSFSQNILPGLFGGFETVGEGIANKYEREAAEDKKREEKLKKQNAAWMDQLYDIPLAYEKDQIQITKQADDYNNWIAGKMYAGEDMDNLSKDDILKKKQMEFELARSKAITDDNKTYIENLKQIINKDQAEKQYKYNGKKAAQFIADFESAATLEDRMRLRSEGNPLGLNLELDDFVDETIPPNETETRTSIFRDPVYHKQVTLDKILNTPGGRDYYDTLKNPNETEEQFADRVVKQGQLRYPPKPKNVPKPPVTPPKTDETNGGYGTGNWKDELSVGYGTNANYKPGVRANTISFTRSGTQQGLPALKLTDASGNNVLFEPTTFHLRDDDYITVLGDIINPDGSRTQTFMDYGANEYAFKSQLLGMDLRKEFQEINNPTSGTSTGGTFTGVPTTGKFNGQ